MLLPAQDRTSTLSFDFPLSRSAALERLATFVPEAGRGYAEGRSHDGGPGRHHAVSRLSAALRRRLISEEEVARAVVAAHGAQAAGKFLQELFWRTYWKGWLEQHPGAWREWQRACERRSGENMPPGYDLAVTGRTGIDAFDAWVRELRETGYLHNWARMQFASIWIFTLGLPWELGAAFTFAHLVDADPASNTLSWRWVAGLHTRGKAYLASADRIRLHTGGRFDPQGLATQADVPRETPAMEKAEVRAPDTLRPDARTLLLLTPEDLSLETESSLATLAVHRVVACRRHCSSAADIAAVADGLQRASSHWQVAAAWVDDLEAVAALAASEGCAQIATGYAPVGPVADALAAYRAISSIPIAEYRRGWDGRAWPYSGKGYFAFARHIPDLLAAAGITDPSAG